MSDRGAESGFGVGSAVRRVEDDRLLRGRGRYADDLAPRDALFARFVRSPHAHAEIGGIDVSAALALPGVVAVVTGADLRRAGRGALPCLLSFPQADGTPARYPPRFALPHDRARFVGEAVAMVVAETAAQAADGVEAVAVDWRPLPPVIGLDQAREMPAIHPEVPGNRVHLWEAGDAAEVERAFARAARLVTTRVPISRVTAAPLETRGAIAQWDPVARRFTLVAATQGTTEA
ncbi:MAG: molybdopterin-dependent oxidoreductase, partial [Elioraea sp.]|nr:molybdopterin-dependent oxidoreductase [Elioraea sp.]